MLGLLPMFVLTLALILPPETRIEVADQALYAYRIAYLGFSPWLIYTIAKRGLRFGFVDALVFGAAGWMIVSFVVLYGMIKGLPSGVAAALDTVVPYLLARVSIRSVNDFRRYLVIVVPLFAIIAIVMPIEAITHTRYIRNAAMSVFGGLDMPFGIKNDLRWGMLRAMGPFSHQILAGLFFTTLLPLYAYSRLRGWPLVVGILSSLAAFFSFSSAAVLGLVIFGILAVYDFLRKHVTFLNWPMFVFALVGMMTAVQMLTESGLIKLLIRLTFKPATGYYRLLIWEHGSASVAKHPIFGIGYEDWERLSWMHTSVDTFWLAVAMRNGLPAAILIFAATIAAITAMAMRLQRDRGRDYATLFGVTVALAILFVQGFTTSFFGGMLIWFGVLLGVAASFGYSSSAQPIPPGAQRVRLRLKPQ